MSQNQGPMTLTAELKFKSDSSLAQQDLERLKQRTNEVNRSAVEAQRSLGRIGGAGGRGMPAPYEVAGSTYNFAGYGGPPPLSQAQANAQRNHPGIHPAAPPVPAVNRSVPAGRGPAAYAPEPFSAHAIHHALATPVAVVAAFAAIAEAADRLTKALDKAAITADAAGGRLSPGGQSTRGLLQTLGELPIAGSLVRGGSSMTEFGVYEQPLGRSFVRAFGGNPNRYRNAREAAYQSQISLESLEPRLANERELDELYRRHEQAGITAEAARRTADLQSQRLPGILNVWDTEPEVAMAMLAQTRAQGAFAAASATHAAARRELGGFEANTITARRTLEFRKQEANERATVFSPVVRMAGFEDETQRRAILEQEKTLLDAQERQKAALQRYEQTGVEMAQKKLELERANLEVTKATASIVDRHVSQQKSGAVQFFTSDPMQRQALMIAGRRFSESGVQSLSPEETQLLLGNAASAEAVTRAIQQRAAGFNSFGDEYNEFTGLFGPNYRQNLAEQRSLRADVTTRFELDEAAAKKMAEDFANAVIPRLIEINKQALEGKIKVIEEQIQLGMASQRAGS